ncbi:uroporphyrinogen-III synthase [Methyloradius palustris]|uniref:Uroporphyrinogen-III synthase n=1 Tax=Methyloradius palustris TaxID=2778876 RepID=A0A8D5G5N2_9PROT|nr:uroporphyrinogen-III synthase [Methyloradius palustris]BCM23781.1 uroporphyrinogen-III synthase [Methyloradius palustris]
MRELVLNKLGIAITRPASQATKLSKLITENGGTPILFPLIEITTLDDYGVFEQKISELNEYHWAIFISSNAVQHGMPRLLKHFGHIPSNLKFAAIGPVTANELAKFGALDVLTPQDRFDSESLLGLSEMQSVKNQRIMIFRGIGGREILAETLKTRGAQVDLAECYQRTNPQMDTNLLATLWQNKQLHAVVVTSSEAMRHLLDLIINSNQAADWIKHVVLCVNHARIAEAPLTLRLKVAIAHAPGDEAMLQCVIDAVSAN